MKTPKKPHQRNIYIIKTEKNQRTLYHKEKDLFCKCIIHKTEHLATTKRSTRYLKLMYLTKEITYPNGMKCSQKLIAVYRGERLLKITNKQELTKDKLYEMLTKHKYTKQYA